MLSFNKSQPKIKERNSIYVVAVFILSLLTICFLLLPVIVNILNGFSDTDSFADIIYYILRGMFGISIAIGASMYAVKKVIYPLALPCFFGFITALFPLYDSISTFIRAFTLAHQLSMNIGYGPYLVTIYEYLLFALLCLFTMLYSIGIFKYTLIIMLISVVSSLSAIFTSIDNFVTYDITLFEILSFAYTALACIIPLIIVLSAEVTETKSTKYKARRMK